MKITRIFRFLAAAAMLAAAPSLSAAEPSQMLKVTDISIARVGDDQLMVSLGIDPRAVDPGRDKEAVFTPVIISADGRDSLLLPSIRVAGRNRYYSHVRSNDLPEGVALHAAFSKEPIAYRQVVPYLPWMVRSRVDMLQALGNCCDTPRPVGPRPLALLDFEPLPYHGPLAVVALDGDEMIERTAEGRAFVDFIVNRTEIRPTYRNNKVEITKILQSIDVIKNDPDAVITRITIKGYASPEGPYSNNVRLAMGRTQSLKEYVREQYSFPQEIMFTDYEPEDWDGLRAFLDTCTLEHRSEIIDIVNSDLQPDPKDAAIRRAYPQEYKYILDNVYPGLRHSDYTIKYNFRLLLDIDELKAAYAAHPDRLRPVDFQRIAATYEPWSPEWQDVYLTAVAIHPDDQKANLNAANIMIYRGDYDKASEYLAKAGDTPQAMYTMGILAGLDADLDRAASMMESAAQLGYEPAVEALQAIDELRHRQAIEYLIEPTPAK